MGMAFEELLVEIYSNAVNKYYKMETYVILMLLGFLFGCFLTRIRNALLMEEIKMILLSLLFILYIKFYFKHCVCVTLLILTVEDREKNKCTCYMFL
jgi:hypothetical protein